MGNVTNKKLATQKLNLWGFGELRYECDGANTALHFSAMQISGTAEPGIWVFPPHSTRYIYACLFNGD